MLMLYVEPYIDNLILEWLW